MFKIVKSNQMVTLYLYIEVKDYMDIEEKSENKRKNSK